MSTKAAKTPDWVIEEHQRWLSGAKTGRLVFEYDSGHAKKFWREEVIAPPKEAGDSPVEAPSVPKLRPQQCPDKTCGKPMAEFDYGSKFECSGCGGVWSVYDLKRLGKFAAA